MRTQSALLLTVALLGTAVAWSLAGDDAESVDLEGVIHRRPDRDVPGKPAVADPGAGGRVRLRVTDATTGLPVFCRVNVVGEDGNFYEPTENLLAPWSLHRLGNREGKGPVRYYGWFFYCDGDCVVNVPPGTATVEVWKGFEYVPQTVSVDVEQDGMAIVNVELDRGIDMAARGWYSGDTHIHLPRRNDTDDERALDLAAAEDIRFAHILCMNDPRTYHPSMERQIWPQFALGPDSERFRGIYALSSGQEYRCGTYGHICLLGGKRLVQADGAETDPNEWPVFGVVADETHTLGGLAVHAHGGYEREIYADFAQQATDGVELLQFALYRELGLEGWYHILNAGFRFPAIGASDYPYCRALGDCRTYCRLGTRTPTFENWHRTLADGAAFMTTGPLLDVTVNGKHPGDTLEFPDGEHSLNVDVNFWSYVAAAEVLQLIVGGKVVDTVMLDGDLPQEQRWTKSLTITEPTWVAVRVAANSHGLEDVEAHTNPVYVQLAGRQATSAASLQWLLDKLDGRIATHESRDFPQREQVLRYFRESRRILANRLTDAAAGGVSPH